MINVIIPIIQMIGSLAKVKICNKLRHPISKKQKLLQKWKLAKLKLLYREVCLISKTAQNNNWTSG